MQLLKTCLLLAALAPAYAADPGKVDIPPPPPLPAQVPPSPPSTPPTPAQIDNDPTLQPEVTIVQRDDATITEYRIGGKLYMQKVKPKVGPEYYLTDDNGTGSFVRRDTDPKVKPPMWVIKRF